LRQLALSWDAVNTLWNNWVVGYSPRLQRDLLGMLGLDRVRRETLFLLAVVTTGLLMAGLAAYFSLRMRRWRGGMDAAARSFRQFTRKLERCAVRPQDSGEAPSAYARRAAAAIPDAADSIHAITAAYLAARYEPDRNGTALRQLTELVRRFRPRYARASR
jgi:hypothetical protein